MSVQQAASSSLDPSQPFLPAELLDIILKLSFQNPKATLINIALVCWAFHDIIYPALHASLVLNTWRASKSFCARMHAPETGNDFLTFISSSVRVLRVEFVEDCIDLLNACPLVTALWMPDGLDMRYTFNRSLTRLSVATLNRDTMEDLPKTITHLEVRNVYGMRTELIDLASATEHLPLLTHFAMRTLEGPSAISQFASSASIFPVSMPQTVQCIVLCIDGLAAPGRTDWDTPGEAISAVADPRVVFMALNVEFKKVKGILTYPEMHWPSEDWIAGWAEDNDMWTFAERALAQKGWFVAPL
ncbi:hypothetical protein CYLTODRAFT_445192 [Cylindrobasidium torrendii FP15055 ss-10]|uniref:Uncharacterized protein n=1 Tax=Cylindrobasidium torrendii FP15055 ss-10 TaxID=1314674 RepID=A0A0D7B688_9AGAR|nr:hypothetical protein CYLTODRAFT_445192 [Cylindrobasidium torrendii FP15055 ss-10]